MSLAMCFRHSEKPARRKCFRCKKNICPSCQRKTAGHIWCSKPCEVRFSIEDRGRRLAAVAHTPLPTSLALLVTAALAFSLAIFVTRSVATLTDDGGSVRDLWSKPAATVARGPSASITSVDPSAAGTVDVKGT